VVFYVVNKVLVNEQFVLRSLQIFGVK